MTIDSLPPLSEIIRLHNLKPKKSLSQNFILDFNLLLKITKSAGDLSSKPILEVGSGPGGLTRALLSQGARVFAIEQDARCLAALQEIKTLYPDRLEILNEDALTYNFLPALDSFANGDKVSIISNLPYGVATKLFTNWLTTTPIFWDQMILMFQREVAQRICSHQGEKHWGRLGLLSSLLSESEILFNVSPESFTPPPQVTSSVIRTTPREIPIECNLEIFERVSKTAFNQRRKMLRQSLKSLGGETLLNKADIDPRLRAQDLDLPDYIKLTETLISDDQS